MAKLSKVRIRGFIAAVVAVIVIIVFIAFVLYGMGIEAPIFSNITRIFGFELE